MVVETETIVHNLWDCVNSYLSYMHYIALPIVGEAIAVRIDVDTIDGIRMETVG